MTGRHRASARANVAGGSRGADELDAEPHVGDDDDEGELCASCVACKHLCYFSAIRCNTCRDGGVICLNHAHETLCACPPARKSVELRHSQRTLEWMLSSLEEVNTAATSQSHR